jgi:hypothetical protein
MTFGHNDGMKMGLGCCGSCPHKVVTCIGVSNPLMSLTVDAFRNNGL